MLAESRNSGRKLGIGADPEDSSGADVSRQFRTLDVACSSRSKFAVSAFRPAVLSPSNLFISKSSRFRKAGVNHDSRNDI